MKIRAKVNERGIVDLDCVSMGEFRHITRGIPDDTILVIRKVFEDIGTYDPAYNVATDYYIDLQYMEVYDEDDVDEIGDVDKYECVVISVKHSYQRCSYCGQYIESGEYYDVGTRDYYHRLCYMAMIYDIEEDEINN